MCGISGLVHHGDLKTLQKMSRIQSHRGPDDFGFEWFDAQRSGLAHQRLSILDLSQAGHQPMCNRAGNRWITYNGEIYNFLELRKELESLGHQFRSSTDTEVLLAAYDEWGIESLRKLNGMFAFGILDLDTDELFLARDALGVKPLYYSLIGKGLAFASEAKALLSVPGVSEKIDTEALLGSLLLMWTPEPRTAYSDILKLEAGCYGIFKNGQLTVHSYDDPALPPEQSNQTISRESDAVEELSFLLERAVKRQMMADVPVGAFLSGTGFFADRRIDEESGTSKANQNFYNWIQLTGSAS